MSPGTAKAWRFGHAPSRPHNRVGDMLEEMNDAGDEQAIAETLFPIMKARWRVGTPDYTPELLAEARQAEAAAQIEEEAFRIDPTTKTWRKLRRAAVLAVHKRMAVIAAADVKFGA